MNITSETLARSILDGFHTHYRRFQALTQGARERFLKRDWTAVVSAAAERIHYYDHQVALTAKKVERRVGKELDEALWQATRQRYQQLLQFHPQAELAETLYNSVFCRTFDRAYVYNDYIFV